MILIVGLGNPGEKYQNNRHNVGFMFVDFLINQYQAPKAKFDKYLHSEITQIKIDNQDVILAKPQTFMNNSGLAVKNNVERLTLDVKQDLIVVHDDLDIPLGKFKIQQGTGPILHRGINSIELALNDKNFSRIRVGVDNRPAGSSFPGEAYVLENFKPEERDIIEQTFPLILERLKTQFLHYP